MLIRMNTDDIYEKNNIPKVFYKKGVLKSFTKFRDKHTCQSSGRVFKKMLLIIINNHLFHFSTSILHGFSSKTKIHGS